MEIKNIEFKARVTNLQDIEKKLLSLKPIFIGIDEQLDTYFSVPTGRLKLREGNIENALIWYKRANTADAKLSTILLYNHKPDGALKQILTLLHGIKVVVQKTRKIYFIDNVKFHLDVVEGLGHFIEVEAIDKDATIGIEKLHGQCNQYAHLFNILPSAYVAYSYSDMLLQSL